MRATRRPCLAFKILAAGRLCDRQETVEQAFEATFRHIKAGDGVIVGMMALTRDEQGGWIDWLYLHPGWTGRGIGSQFVELAKAQLVNEQNKAAESSIRLYTFQENSGGRRFYERHGFKAIAFGDGSANEEGTPDVLYEWRPEDQSEGY